MDMGLDGPVELHDALTCITHARNCMGNKPGLLLMAMFPNHGKARFEIVFVYRWGGGWWVVGWLGCGSELV